MTKITSKDGTPIVFDRLGDGPALVMIGGGPTNRFVNAPLAELLATGFTVYNYDRRGRGESGDTSPYSFDREVEDLQALIAEIGESVYLYGTSGGGIVALEMAAKGLPVDKVAVWETPYIVDGSRPPVPADYRDQLVALLAADRRGDMIELFFTAAVGMPLEAVTPMRTLPFWESMEAVAPALVYDATITGDFSLPTERLSTIMIPTLVIDGGTTPWLTAGAEAVAAALPNARRRTLPGQPHNVAPDAIAPALREFFAE